MRDCAVERSWRIRHVLVRLALKSCALNLLFIFGSLNALNKLLAIFQKVSTTETCVLECSYPRNNSSGEAPLQTLVLDSSTMILIDQSYESGTRRTYVRICELEIAGICCHALNRLKRDCHNYSWVVVQDSRHFVV